MGRLLWWISLICYCLMLHSQYVQLIHLHGIHYHDNVRRSGNRYRCNTWDKWNVCGPDEPLSVSNNQPYFWFFAEKHGSSLAPESPLKSTYFGAVIKDTGFSNFALAVTLTFWDFSGGDRNNQNANSDQQTEEKLHDDEMTR